MTIDTNQRWNTMLSNLATTAHELHTVNIHQLLKELRHCGTRSVRDSGQNYTYASMEDIHGALENIIAKANATQNPPFVVLDSTNFVVVIEKHLHGFEEAKDVYKKSLGCATRATIRTPTIYIQTHILKECLDLYEELCSSGNR